MKNSVIHKDKAMEVAIATIIHFYTLNSNCCLTHPHVPTALHQHPLYHCLLPPPYKALLESVEPLLKSNYSDFMVGAV